MNTLRTALGIPHTPWIPERAANMVRLRAALQPEAEGAVACEFTEKAPWPIRSTARWAWAIETGAAWFLQLEDDVIVPEDGRFWPSAQAMQEAWPGEMICLAATHSMGPIVASHGRRSYKTPRVLGWGWMAPMETVKRLHAYASQGALLRFVKKVEQEKGGVPTEDAFLAETFVAWGMMPRHPCPTIVDQLHLPSTLGEVDPGFDWHTNTQASVTWRDFAAADMASPDWWRTPHTFLPAEWTQNIAMMIGPCHWCGKGLGEFVSHATAMNICRTCVQRLALKAMGVNLPATPAPAKPAPAKAAVRTCRLAPPAHVPTVPTVPTAACAPGGAASTNESLE